MPPLTRSSAPSTPAKQRVSTGSVSPPSAGARRTPRCTKCHRPRAGHPRSGCPYVDAEDSNPPSPSAKKPPPQVAPAPDDGLLDELSSLKIVSPTEESALLTGRKLRRRLSVRFALVPEQTLASLSPTDSHLVEQLFQPGMIADTVSPQDTVAHVLKWQKTLDDADPVDDRTEEATRVKTEESGPASATPPRSRRMPCTLSTPTASLTVTELATDRGIGGSSLNMNDTVYLLPDTSAERTQPLGRSMSLEERSSFLQQLGHSSRTAPATLLSLPLADLDNMRSDAEKLGFHIRILPSNGDGNKWVVLGTEEEAIDLLADKFLEEEKRSSTGVEGKGGKLTAVAGGVVFGAVATWTGLAFS